MKTKELLKIAGKKNIDVRTFEGFMKLSDKYKGKIKNSFTGCVIDDDINVSELIADFTAEQEAKAAAEREYEIARQAKAREAREAKERAEAEKRRALAAMLISSGFNFEGYRIVKYSGYISGDDAIQVDRGTSGYFSRATNVGDALMNNLTKIRRNALAELKEAAYALGCNAVIGVDFDYLTLDPQTANSSGGTTYLPYVFGVTANGNAVIIEKIDDDEE